jgi:hypothetical protein
MAAASSETAADILGYTPAAQVDEKELAVVEELEGQTAQGAAGRARPPPAAYRQHLAVWRDLEH